MIPTVRAGPCTSCGTPACNTWPRPAAARPNCRAKSRHQHLASLGVYVHLGAETAARVTADHDPATRRRHNW